MAGIVGLMLGGGCGGCAALALTLTRSQRMASNRVVIHLAQIAVLATAVGWLLLLQLLEPVIGIKQHSSSHYVALYTSLFAWGCTVAFILRVEHRLRKSAGSAGKNLAD